MNKDKHKKLLIVIAGPTASGKTSLAIELAKKLKAEIISADSRQVYKEMSIGTAKPTINEMQGVPHHFIGNVSIKEKYDVGIYEREVLGFLEKYYQKNEYAILVGGTGLYINAVLYGLDKFPDVDEEVKLKLNEEYQEKGIEHLQNELKEVDFDYYDSVDKNNAHRLIRALSVYRQSGSPYSSFLDKTRPKREFEPIKILLDTPREVLYQRINDRVDDMLIEGLEEEAGDLYQFKHLKALQTVGYKELFKYFDGDITKEEAIDLLKQNTRRYAKRQMTWFRNKGKWNVFDAKNTDEIYDFIIKNSE